jgi:hypothetical protein
MQWILVIMLGGAIGLTACGGGQSQTTVAGAPEKGCPPAERREALREVQSKVLSVAPGQIDSFAEAMRPGGPLEGWSLSHGHVVIAGGMAVPTDNLNAKDPWPPLLLYSPSGKPEDWLDFEGEDGPYRLAGWGYFVPYSPGSSPPNFLRCVDAGEWIVHEAGWHLKNGSMHLTPGATEEPPRPDLEAGIHMWHPQIWDIHFWRGDDGTPAVSFNNPNDKGGGLALPEGSFYYLIDGRRVPPPAPGK